MFLIQSETDLLNAFRPRDRRVMDAPKDLQSPLYVRDYFAWVDPSGVRVYLVLQDPRSKRPLGIAFRRDAKATPGVMMGMCEWCHSVGSADEIGLLTTDKSSKKIIGVGLCRDLRCQEKLEEQANLSGRSPVEPKKRMLERMERFAREGLGIAEVPAP